jgi:hypothetical protein
MAWSDSNFAAAVGLQGMIDVIDDEIYNDVLPQDDVAPLPDAPSLLDEDGQELFKSKHVACEYCQQHENTLTIAEMPEIERETRENEWHEDGLEYLPPAEFEVLPPVLELDTPEVVVTE